MHFIKIIGISCTILALTACGSTPSTSNSAEYGTMMLYKSDNSVQCESQGEDEYTAAERLRSVGVDVICQAKVSDGKIRTMQCGGKTGMYNLIKIPEAHYKKAKKQGYRPISQLKGYNGTACLY